jgi:hypothetical protein
MLRINEAVATTPLTQFAEHLAERDAPARSHAAVLGSVLPHPHSGLRNRAHRPLHLPPKTFDSQTQTQKNDIIAHTMQFTDLESKEFWPVYRDYAYQQGKIDDEGSNYDTMNDDMASDFVQRLINIEDECNNLREGYWPKFKKAIGARRAVKCFQLDHRLSVIVNKQLARATPLLP